MVLQYEGHKDLVVLVDKPFRKKVTLSRSKSHSASEDLKGENRNLRKQVKVLKKEVGALKKRLSKYESFVDNFTYERDDEPQFEDIVDDNRCVECGRGDIITVDLGARKLVRCTICEYRKVLK